MTELAYRIVCGLGVVISIISVFSSAYILISWWKLKKLKKNDLLNDYVAYMSIFDLYSILLRGIYLTSPTFNGTFMSQAPTALCKILGFSHQLSVICMTTWNFIIAAFILLPLTVGKPMFKIIKHRCKHIIFLIFITFIFVLIPFINNGYGLTDNGASQYGLSKYECWISNNKDFISVYGPIAFYYVFSIGLLLWSVLCGFEHKEELLKLKSQLIWYTSIFVVVWTMPIINRFYGFFTNKTSYGLTYMTIISIHSVGFANAIVWYHYMKPSVVDVQNPAVSLKKQRLLSEDRKINNYISCN
eukprot:421837_1